MNWFFNVITSVAITIASALGIYSSPVPSPVPSPIVQEVIVREIVREVVQEIIPEETPILGAISPVAGNTYTLAAPGISSSATSTATLAHLMR